MFNLFKRKKQSGLIHYSEAELDVLERFVADTFGPCDRVLHEVASEDIHVDIYLADTRETESCWTLVTLGMGARPMRVPPKPELRDFARADLVMCLPPDWKLEEKSQEWFWPMTMLKMMAHLPIDADTWLGAGHTVDFEGPLAKSAEFSAAMVLDMAPADQDGGLQCVLPGGEKVNFYQVFPLYADERDFCETYSTGEFVCRTANQLDPVVNPARPSLLADDFADYLDCADDHSEKIAEKNLPLDPLMGCAHMAIYLRWMIGHDMMADWFKEEFGANPGGDLRVFIMEHLHALLLARYFSEEGAAFSLWYYGADADEDLCYPADVDAYALALFGEEKYNSPEFADEAYMFVPWDEAYYRGMSQLIDEKYAQWKRETGR